MKKSSRIRNKYDLKDVARILDISYVTVAKLCREGKIKYTKIAQKYYVSKRELNSYMGSDKFLDQPADVVIKQIDQAIRLTFEANIPVMADRVKSLIIDDLTENIQENFKEIAKSYGKLEKDLPEKAMEHINRRIDQAKKEFEKEQKKVLPVATMKHLRYQGSKSKKDFSKV